MTNFDYKKYSLSQLDNWVNDAISCSEATPQEIYDTIIKVIDEQYVYFKQNMNRVEELKNLLNGNKHNDSEHYDAVIREREYYEPSMPPWGHSDMEGLICNSNNKSEECKKSWNDFWEENNASEEHSQYTEKELEAMCDAAEKEENSKSYKEVKKENNSERIQKIASMNYSEAIAAGWTMTDDGFWIPPQEKNTVKKWSIPVEIDDASGDYFLTLPQDLLDQLNWKENDKIEYVNNHDGSFTVRKV